MTDWFSGDDGAAQMNAGNHMIMPGTKMQYEQILAAIKNGNLKMSMLDANVDKVLNLILRSQTFKHYKYSNKPNLAANADVAKNAAAAGFVLLKNENNTLPLKSGSIKIALFGNSAYHSITGGTGSGDVNKAYGISIADGLNKYYAVNKTLQQQYNIYLEEADKKIPKPVMFFMPKELPAEKIITATEAAELANNNDEAILTIGRTSGEFVDRKLDDDFYLTQTEKDNLKTISDAFHAKNKSFIVLLNIGGVIEMKSWQAMADAILLVWQPGQEGGNAVKDVISGLVNPSGKLATTFPVDYPDAASAKGFPGTPAENPTQVKYTEGIYVGYRFFEKNKVPVVYPFGYGLSYTDFSYSDIKISSAVFRNELTVTADITNTGNAAGKEVVQLYMSAPVSKLDKPVKELKGFVKTSLLQPGKKQTVTFVISRRDLASFDETQSAWVADKGTYEVSVGSSSAGIKLKTTFTLTNELLVKKVNNVVAPETKITELQ
jgi:beta-glucosidase